METSRQGVDLIRNMESSHLQDFVTTIINRTHITEALLLYFELFSKLMFNACIYESIKLQFNINNITGINKTSQ
jgi:hypothetical protein